MIYKKLRFCAWNIQGYNSRQIGNKFEDKEFLECFKEMNFGGITETHVHTEVLDKLNIWVHKLRNLSDIIFKF